MKVLHVIPALGPVYGGPSRLVPELGRALAQQGVAVDIATTDANGSDRLIVPKGIAVNDGRVRTFYFPRLWMKQFTCSLPLARWIWRHCHHYDLIHIGAVFSFSTLAASRIARQAGRPYIISPHGMLEPWALRHKAWKKSLYLRMVERPALTRAAALHALASNEAESLHNLGLSTRSFVIPNGVDVDGFSRLPSPEAWYSRYPQLRDRIVLLFLGRVDRVKGLDLLVKAFGRLMRRGRPGPRPVLVIAGPDRDGYRAKIECLVDQEGMRDHVLFTGMLSTEERLTALAAADIFVLPSRSEGLPVALLEALAAGCPVIATDACNLSGLQEAGAGVVIKANVADLESSLSSLVDNLGDARSMGARGREFARDRFNWPMVASEMVKIYHDVVNGTVTSKAWTHVA